MKTQIKRTKKNKETFKQKLLNNIFVIFLAGIMLLGLKSYSAGSNTLTFAQVSDVHYSSAQTNTSYRLLAESGELLKDAVDQINMVSNLDFVMFTGDMINTPYENELKNFLSYANQINAPWYAVFGNHDICIGGNLTKELYLKILRENNNNFTFDKPYYSFEPKPGYKVIGLDTIIDTRITSNGQLGEEELNWLDNELTNSKDETVLIFMHGPLVEPLPSSSHRTLDADKAISIINKHKNPVAVFSGHYHTTKIFKKGNVLYVCTPALISYPNAFRIIHVDNEKNKTIFNLEFKETGLKEVQRRAKMMAFGSRLYYGNQDDREGTYELKRDENLTK